MVAEAAAFAALLPCRLPGQLAAPAARRGWNRRPSPHLAHLQAHIEAAEALEGPDCPLGGRAYFVTNDEPRTFWGFMGDVCEGMGYPRPHVKSVAAPAPLPTAGQRLGSAGLARRAATHAGAGAHGPSPLWCIPRRLPFGLIYFIALIVQLLVVPLCRLLGRDMQSDFTPARIKITATNRTFSCAAARRDFGYTPKVCWCVCGGHVPHCGWRVCRLE